MKHAANRSKSTVKPKAKTLTQIKPVTKKTSGKVALNSRRQKPVKKTKPVAESAPKNPPILKNTAVQKNAPKLSTKTLTALKAISVRKVKPAAKQIEKPKARKLAPKTLVKATKNSPKTAAAKTIKPANLKAKQATAAKKAVKKKVVKLDLSHKPKLKTPTAKPKNAVRASDKQSLEATKPQSSKTTIQKANTRLPKAKTTTAAVKIKSVPQKSKQIAAAKKPKNTEKAKTSKDKKTVPIVAAQKVIRKANKVQPVAPKKLADKAVKVKLIVEPKKAAGKIDKSKPIAAAKKVVRKTIKMKPAISAAKIDSPKQKIKKAVAVEKIKLVENVVEEVKPRPQKPKKAKAISSAVFRGKKDQYGFQVYPLDAVFEDVSAIYIISKRKIDKRKRAHHALVCIGQTDSILGEIKKHKKGKCVKKHAANVISLLPETNEIRRLKIETDLKAAHSIPCVHA